MNQIFNILNYIKNKYLIILFFIYEHEECQKRYFIIVRNTKIKIKIFLFLIILFLSISMKNAKKIFYNRMKYQNKNIFIYKHEEC